MTTINKYIRKGAGACRKALLSLCFPLFALAALLTGCSDYLDIVPENNLPVITICVHQWRITCCHGVSTVQVSFSIQVRQHCRHTPSRLPQVLPSGV